MSVREMAIVCRSSTLALALCLQACAGVSHGQVVIFEKREVLPDCPLAVAAPRPGTGGLRVYWPSERKQAYLKCPTQLQGIFCLSPDGRWLVTPASETRSGPTPYDRPEYIQRLHLTDVTRGTTETVIETKNQVNEPATCADWSPDSRVLYYAYFPWQKWLPERHHPEDPVAKINAYDLDGKRHEQVVAIEGYIPAAIVPDPVGKHLVVSAFYTHPKKGYQSGLFLIDPIANTYKPIENTSGVFYVSWAPDGRSLAYVVEANPGTLMSFSLDEPIANAWLKNDMVAWPAWSPRGDVMLLAVQHRSYFYKPAENTMSQIQWFNFDIPRSAGGHALDVRWSGDGRYVVGNVILGAKLLHDPRDVYITYYTFIADMERKEIMLLDMREYHRPVYFIEDVETLRGLREAKWVKETLEPLQVK